MPILKGSKKANRQNIKKRRRNYVRRRSLHDVLKEFYNAVKGGDVKAATGMLSNVYKTIDMSAKNRIIPANRAARMKSKAQKAVSTK